MTALRRIFKYLFFTISSIILLILFFYLTGAPIPFLAGIVEKKIYTSMPLLKDEVKIGTIGLGLDYSTLHPQVVIRNFDYNKKINAKIKKVSISLLLIKSIKNKTPYVDNIHLKNGEILLNKQTFKYLTNNSKNSSSDNTNINKQKNVTQDSVINIIQDFNKNNSYFQYLRYISINNFKITSYILNHKITYDIEDTNVDFQKLNTVQEISVSSDSKLYLDEDTLLKSDLTLVINSQDNLTAINKLHINHINKLLPLFEYYIGDSIKEIDFPAEITTNIKANLQNSSYDIQGKIKAPNSNIKLAALEEKVSFSTINIDYLLQSKTHKLVSNIDLVLNKTNIVNDDLLLNIPLDKVESKILFDLEEKNLITQSKVNIKNVVANIDYNSDFKKSYINVNSDNLQLKDLQNYWPKKYLPIVYENISYFKKATIVGKRQLILNFDASELKRIIVSVNAINATYSYANLLPIDVKNLSFLMSNNDIKIEGKNIYQPTTGIKTTNALFFIKNLDVASNNSNPILLQFVSNKLIRPVSLGEIQFATDDKYFIGKTSNKNSGDFKLKKIRYINKENIDIGNINILLNQSQNIQLSGRGNLLGSYLDFSSNIKPDNNKITAMAKLVNFNSEKLAKLEFIPMAIASMTDIQGDVKLDFLQDGNSQQYKIDMTHSNVWLDLFDWGKKASVPFLINVNNTNNNYKIEGTSENFILKGNMILSENVIVNIDKLYTNNTDISGNLYLNNDTLSLKLLGPKLDVTGVSNFAKRYKKVPTKKEKKSKIVNYDMRAQIANIKNHNRELNNINFYVKLNDNNLKELNVYYVTQKKANSISLVNNKILTKLQDIGYLYQFITSKTNVKNGILDSEIILKDNIKKFEGNINIKNLKVSFLGNFKIDSEIKYDQKILNIPSLTIRNIFVDADMEGYVDFNESYLDIHGKAKPILIWRFKKYNPYIKGNFDNIKYSLTGK